MSIYFKYSLFQLLEEYQKNRDIIHAKLNNKSIENYKDSDGNGDNDTVILGMGVVIFVININCKFCNLDLGSSCYNYILGSIT